MRAWDGSKQVRRGRSNAALAWQVVANKSNLADFRSFLRETFLCSTYPEAGAEHPLRCNPVLRKLMIVVALVRMNHDGGFVRRLGRAYGDHCCRGPCLSPFFILDADTREYRAGTES
jgi:hypothetical protein